MYIQPSSLIELFTGVPLDNRYLNTILFTNTTTQNSYFTGTSWGGTRIPLTEYSYARSTANSIQVNLPYNRVYNVNYLRFRNTSYEDKWFYGFVNKVEYINDNCSRLYWELDVMQTWLPDIDYKLTDCFVEREHSATDNVGDNLVDEGLGLSDYKFSNQTTGISTYKIASGEALDEVDYKVVVMVTKLHKTDKDEIGFNLIDNTCTGSTLVVFDLNTEYQDLVKFMQGYYAVSEQVTAIYMLPNDTITDDMLEAVNVNDESVTTPTPTLLSVNIIKTGSIGRNDEWFTNISYGDNIDGYTNVKNKKLFTYPYNFLTVYNNEGDNNIYRFEFFGSNIARFKIQDKLLPPYKVTCRPEYYKGWTDNLVGEGIVTPFVGLGLSIENTPVCNWLNDTYKAWLDTQGKFSIAQGVLSNSTLVGASAPKLAEGISYQALDLYGSSGTAVNGVLEAELIAKAGLKMTPMTALGVGILGAKILSDVVSNLREFNMAKIHDVGNNGSLNSGSVDYTHRIIGFYAVRTFITREWAEKLDDFFNCYGYATKTVKVPNIKVRPYWTYTKTNGSAVRSINAPTEDIVAINKIFDNGIRFFNGISPVENYNEFDNSPTTPV